MTQISDLFPALPGLSPSAQSAKSADTPRCGRGATPQINQAIDVRHANPGGRTKLSYRFRPLQKHQLPACDALSQEVPYPYLVKPPGERAIWQVGALFVARYFERIGGFRIADDAVMTAWSDLVAAGDFTAQEILWAIDAHALFLKGESRAERDERLKFRIFAENFPRRLAHWLEQSTDYQAAVRRRTSTAAAEHLSAGLSGVVALRAQADAADARIAQARAAGDQALYDAEIRVRAEREQQRRAEQDRLSAARDAAASSEWNGLSQTRRDLALRAVRARFEDYIRRCSGNPEDPAYDSLLIDWALGWARTKWPVTTAPPSRVPGSGVREPKPQPPAPSPDL